MDNENTCQSCHQNVESSWRYCRYCGAALRSKPRETPKIEIDAEITREVKEKVVFDKDLYYMVLSTRSERTELIKEKNKLKDDTAALLEQVESGVVSREYALPKIKDLKVEVADVNKREEKFKELPSQLPVELLLDQIDAAEKRMKKIDELRKDPAITKEAIKEAKTRSENALQLLREEESVISGHLRSWRADIDNDLEKERKELEQLYIRVKTGELAEEAYKEKKMTKAADIAKLSNISSMLINILD